MSPAQLITEAESAGLSVGRLRDRAQLLLALIDECGLEEWQIDDPEALRRVLIRTLHGEIVTLCAAGVLLAKLQEARTPEPSLN